MKHITSRDNIQFKSLRKLAEDSREQRRENATVIDGPHLVTAYRQHVGLPELLVVSESGLESAEVKSILTDYPGETLSLRDSLFREISGTETPVGVAAIIRIPDEASDPLEGDCVILDGVQDAGNMGSILRSATAAGVVNVTIGPGCAGAWTPKVLRAAQGAHFSLHIREHSNLEQAIHDFPGTTLATVVNGADPSRTALRGRVAWIFGSEGRGLSPALAAACDRRVSIALAGDCESLNVAAAAAICLFEARRQKLGEDA